ncbi:MAG TPA: hypothetical protein VGC88_11985 [Terriglobales bacterium]|jgi:hypothetical protein
MTTRHLTNEEIAGWPMGHGMGQELHVMECESCRKKVDEMSSALSFFRTAMHQWADTASVAPRTVAAKSHIQWMRLAVPVFAMLLLVLVPLLHRNTSKTLATPSPAETAQISDEQLSEEIDSDLQQSVPDSMMPLADVAQDAVNAVRQAKKR